MKGFQKDVQSRVLVCDGAMGTMLYSKGVYINQCFDELNISAPQLVSQIHAEYLKAGARSHRQKSRSQPSLRGWLRWQA